MPAAYEHEEKDWDEFRARNVKQGYPSSDRTVEELRQSNHPQTVGHWAAGEFQVPVWLSVRVSDLGGGGRFVWQAFLYLGQKTVTIAKSNDNLEFPTSDLAKNNALEHLAYLAHRIVWDTQWNFT